MSSVKTQLQMRRPMTVQEIEAACRELEPPECEEYYNDAPALTLETMLFPLGFRCASGQIQRRPCISAG